MRWMRTLRARVAAAGVLAVAIALAAVGIAVVSTFSNTERDQLDKRLTDRAQAAREALGPPGAGPPGDARGAPPQGGPPPVVPRRFLPRGAAPGGAPRFPGREGPPDATRQLDEALARGAESARIVVGGRVLSTFGAPTPSAGFPEAGNVGAVETVSSGGKRYRSLTLEGRVRMGTGAARDAQLQVAAPLGEVDERIADLRQKVILIGLGGLLLAALAILALETLAMRSLSDLRRQAAGLRSAEEPDARLPRGGPSEVDELAGTLNQMLERTAASAAAREEALSASRRFAADAGHELRTPLAAVAANLDTLQRHPDLDADQRAEMLRGLTEDSARMAALLDALQALARGDAAEAVPREPLDVADIADAAVQAARRRHPEAEFALDAPQDIRIQGWPDGLRLAIDNLLENAVKHGGSRVELSVRPDGVTVEDDGPGIPAGDRERVLRRFERGKNANGTGSGLGLALVEQQAKLHGGRVSIEDSPLGGARVRLEVLGQDGARGERS